MTDTPEHDPLDALLAPPELADAEGLRQAVLGVTGRRLRRRRWLRRGAMAAALATCFAAGMLTMRWLTPAAPPEVARADVPHEQKAPSAPTEQPPAPPPHDTDVAAVLFKAGDHFLNEEGDPETALRAYTKALDTGSPDETKFSPDDNWLLMALKNAREKEARHANNDG
jgi:hypothetical protein